MEYGENIEQIIGSSSPEVSERLTRLVRELKRHGYRVTAQRLAVARIVFETVKDHPSFMEILEKARREIPNISPSTVYNNLQLLEKLGFIKSFSIHGETRYDNVHTHVNVVCIDTGKVFDLDDAVVAEELTKALKSKLPDARIENIVVYARCSCRDKEASGPG